MTMIEEVKTSRLKTKVKHPKRQMARKILIFVSFMLFPVTIFYLSPYLSFAGPMQGYISACLFVFGSLFILSLFVGRLFCSYVCPMAGMQEAISKIQARRINRKSFFVK